ncbi:winged helix-turn-helix domain-containing protein [Streptosporangium sp. NPDC052375]|uniref:winged helix-turn-helix domain-containing protein n=1 Tax=Streptosporangium sp. NPDC052375 TaxID=3366195 RepID=UPI0037CFBD1B
MWTLERVGCVVERVCGVRLSRASVWRLLTGRLDWSLQRPERRAVERDEAEIARWVDFEWPRIKRGPWKTGDGSCSLTNPAYRCCRRCAARTPLAAARPRCGTG